MSAPRGGTPRKKAAPRRPPQRGTPPRRPGGSRPPQRVGGRDLRDLRDARRGRADWWQQPWVIPAAVLAIAAVIGVVVLAGRSGGSGSTGLPGNAASSPAPASIASAVTSLPVATFASVGDGGVAQPLKAVSGQQPLTGADGKPLFLYMGADYCPFCAAERWSLVIALSRFGTVGGLALTSSSSSDAYADTNTLDFSHLTFSSTVLDVQAVELQDRSGQALESPSPSQSATLQALDQPPYSDTAGAIPFVDIANRYVAISSGYSPAVLQGLTWDQIAQKLSDPNDAVTRAIVGNANRITAGICAATGSQPASVCGAAPIQQLASQLPSS